MKRYVREPGTALVRRLLAESSPATSRFSEVEVASAVARRSREGTLSIAGRDRVLRAWVADLQALHLVEVTDETAGIARAMLLRHALGAGDAVQLASCLILQQSLRTPVPMVPFDDRLREAEATSNNWTSYTTSAIL